MFSGSILYLVFSTIFIVSMTLSLGMQFYEIEDNAVYWNDTDRMELYNCTFPNATTDSVS